jgi:hypothetical protein
MEWREKLAANRIWRSLVRHGLRPTNRNRVLLVMENVFLHLHAAKVRRRNVEFSSTFYLGGITLVLFAVLVGTGLL